MPDPLPYHFDNPKRQITITDPRLPQPWINYLSNGTLHAFVSQAGGGTSWWKSPLKNRLTHYRQYNLPIDSPGFYIYLKGHDGIVFSGIKKLHPAFESFPEAPHRKWLWCDPGGARQ